MERRLLWREGTIIDLHVGDPALEGVRLHVIVSVVARKHAKGRLTSISAPIVADAHHFKLTERQRTQRHRGGFRRNLRL
jgi:hypothetical protein